MTFKTLLNFYLQVAVLKGEEVPKEQNLTDEKVGFC